MEGKLAKLLNADTVDVDQDLLSSAEQTICNNHPEPGPPSVEGASTKCCLCGSTRQHKQFLELQRLLVPRIISP